MGALDGLKVSLVYPPYGPVRNEPGIRTVKAFRLEQPRMAEYEQQNRTFLDRTMRMLRAKAMSMTQTFVGYQIGFGLLILLLGYFVLVVPNGIKFSAVATVLLPLSTTYQHVKRLTRSYNTLMESVSALDRIEALLAERSDQADAGGEPLRELRGAVELDGCGLDAGDGAAVEGESALALRAADDAEVLV